MQVLTVFDNEFTRFKTIQKDSGAVYMYERINDTLVYAQEFIYEDDDSMFFGKNLLVRENHVYTAMPRRTDGVTFIGQIVDFRKTVGAKAWKQHRTPIDQVDIDNIKNVFLYNTKTNVIVEDLDFIDPVQGKIAGTAEQELSFKTYYDHATYSIGDSNVVVDEENAWGDAYVGKLWWDVGSAKFYNYQMNDITYQTNYWGEVFPSTRVQVYEWVQSDLLPSEWNELADTNEGISRGISGVTRYDDSVYSQRLVWDPIAKTSKAKYFYWVANKKTVPAVDFRKISANEVTNLIQNPAGQGYKFVALMGRIDMHCLIVQVMDDRNIALNPRYYTLDNKHKHSIMNIVYLHKV